MTDMLKRRRKFASEMDRVEYDIDRRLGRAITVLPRPIITVNSMTHKDMFDRGCANVAKWDYSIMSQRLEDDERGSARLCPHKAGRRASACRHISLAELASKAGIDADGLTTTIANFNRNAEAGKDPEFSRGMHPWSAWMSGDPFNKPHPNLGTVTKTPFHAVELRRLGGSAIPAAGVVSDHHSRAAGSDNKPIEGLYVAGHTAACLESGAMMQSGLSNARGMSHGYLAGLHASGKASELLEKEAPRFEAQAA